MATPRVETPARPATTTPANGRASGAVTPDVGGAAHQAFWLLRIGFTVAPRIGAFVVAGWLFGIVFNLLTKNPPEYYDIALRDFGLMLGALTLGRLALAVVPARKAGTLPRRPW
jgi:hypothetical protein